ncbi:autoimmune regulator [Fistulifera solaris]|uniref:Autoimmune regulator n=1 Tax=Fistulifera solaris TaxID=1519565 RepID=A0A1Z5JRH3_FISSO|nr:autoimmune regulator [Fistulifera solaris]|eukprot:GAX16617.1 autoimmune regulator [Fistulifera solaris]
MNGATNRRSSRLFSDVAYDTTFNENRRLEDRQCIALSPVAHVPQQDEKLEERKKQLPLKSGFDEVFIDLSLPSATKLVSKDLSIKKRSEEMRLTYYDITEIPAAALQDEIDARFEKRKRSEKGENESARKVSSGNEGGKKSIRIGAMYQADVHSRIEGDDFTSADLGTDQIWDSQRAAALLAHELEQYLNQSDDFNIRMVLLEALHCANYDLERATRMFYRIFAQRPGLSVEFSQAESKKFDTLCRNSVIGQGKNFREAARLMNRPMETVLVQYYKWKGRNRAAYNLLKNKRRREPDQCCFCKDGGLLIVCNSCCRAFHLLCLQPPLKGVPDGDWYCTLCTNHSPTRLRRSPEQNLNILSAIRLDFEEQSPSPVSKPRMDVRLQQLKAAHKELSLLTNAHVTSTLKTLPNNHQMMDASPASIQDHGDLYSDYDDENERKYNESPPELDDSTKEDSDSDYTPKKRRCLKVTDSVASSSKSIEVILPVCSEGFRMKIGEKRDGSVAFVEFSRGEKGDKGYAEVCKLIHPGDVITHVDGEPCKKDIRKAMDLMVAPNGFGAKVMRVTRKVIAGQQPPFHLPMAHPTQETDSRYLTFLLPLVPEGFCLRLGEKRGVCKIEGYSEKNGKKGFAEFYNLFRPGDEIVAIDGYNCVGLLLRDVLPLFRMASQNGWRVVTIRRWIQSMKKPNTPSTRPSADNS